MTVAEVCRKMGISEATFYRWKQIYGGMGPSELRKMRQLEEENQKLKRLVANLSLDKAMLQEVLAKSLAPDRRREIVRWLQDQIRVNECRCCQTMRFHRRTHHYKSIRDSQVPLRKRIKEIAETLVR